MPGAPRHMAAAARYAKCCASISSLLRRSFGLQSAAAIVQIGYRAVRNGNFMADAGCA